MMYYAKLYLDTRRALMDGSYPVKLYLKLRKSYYLSTKYKAVEGNWNVSEYNRNERNYQAKNVLLRKMVNDIELYLLNECTEQQSDKVIKERVDEILSGGTGGERKTLLYWMERAMVKKKSASQKSLMQSAMIHVRGYDAHCTLSSADGNWIKGFIEYLRNKGLRHNTCVEYVEQIKYTYNFAIDMDATSYYPFRRLRLAKEPTRKRSLPIGKIAGIACMNVNKECKEKARDMFMLIFYLIGINMADLSAATWNDVHDGRLEYKRAKTGRLYSIKLEPEAMAIINKYRGKKMLLNIFEKPGSCRTSCNMNYHLRSLTGMNDISTYWARHSWATVASSLDISKDVISAALGHENGSRITSIYIDFDQRKVDDANRKVLDHLFAIIEKMKG